MYSNLLLDVYRITFNSNLSFKKQTYTLPPFLPLQLQFKVQAALMYHHVPVSSLFLCMYTSLLSINLLSCCQSTSSKPEMKYLMKLSSPQGDIRIIEETANSYKEIGTILLNDKNGAILAEIQKATRGEPKEAIREVYGRWMRKDESFSWQKLTQCFRDCDLNVLAFNIEQHLRFLLPQSSQTSMPFVLHESTSLLNLNDLSSFTSMSL